jgi:hypothetical protein
MIAVHATLLSSAVVDFMDIYKSWACPRGMPLGAAIGLALHLAR